LLISVVTACYNSATTLSGALNSVLNQKYNELEHIVIDGASTDHTRDILEARPQGQLRWSSEPDQGIYDALNKGIALATGDIVGFLHADDVYAGTDVLAHVARAFEDPAVHAVYGDLQYVSKDNLNNVIRHWRAGEFKPALLKRGWMPPHPSLYVRRECYARIGGFDIKYAIAADYYSILQLFSQPEFNAVYIPEVFVKMRVGGASNRSLKNIIQKSREDYDVLRRTGVGGLSTLMFKNAIKLEQFF
jgi:glycosyltransferase involved in cell wall biosynthesis